MTAATPKLPDFSPISTMLFADEEKLVRELCGRARLDEAEPRRPSGWRGGWWRR